MKIFFKEHAELRSRHCLGSGASVQCVQPTIVKLTFTKKKVCLKLPAKMAAPSCFILFVNRAVGDSIYLH